MAKQIGELTNKASPAGTDEIPLQEAGLGSTLKATLANIGAYVTSILGTAATEDIQTSTTDTTAGRAMIVGAGGVLSSSLTSVSGLSASNRTEFLNYSSAATDSPDGNGGSAITINRAGAAGFATQLAISQTSSGVQGLYARGYWNGVWESDWRVVATLDAAQTFTANQTFSGGLSGALTGNASTATTLQTARTINGVSFDGSANINVNTVASATFNNSGSGAASGTTFNGGTARTISYNTIGAPSTSGTNATGTWGISVTGNAATATTLATARAINGVNFNGSAAITVPGNFANRTTNESGHVPFISTTATGNQSQYTNAAFRFNPSTGVLSSVNYNATSDARLKSEWQSPDSGYVTMLAGLQAGSFAYTDSGYRTVGVTAQGVQTIAPDAVHDENGVLKLDVAGFSALSAVELAKAVVALQDRIDYLESKDKH
jgi:hypothetical protein